MHILGLGTVESVFVIIFGTIFAVSGIVMIVHNRKKKKAKIESWEAEYVEATIDPYANKEAEDAELDRIGREL